jgi:hypothetical protein
MASGDRPNTGPSKSVGDGSPSSPLKKPQAKKAKAGSSKKMTQREQSERFEETARNLGADESGEAFESAINSLLTRRKRPSG